MSVSCAGGRRPAVIGPVPDPARVAEALERETPLEEPLQINFRWRLNEDRQRHGGIGVARVEPPYRARLDLFTDDLESVVTAVLVDGSLVLPPGSRDDILPPVDLMWATLGVFRPHDARLVDGQLLEGGATRLRYAYPDGSELHYQIQEGALRSVELVREGRVAQWVELTLEAGSRYPAEAKYRNLPAYRELTIVREELAVVAPFDPEIWDPV
ncbi:MAG: hypothetical protein PVJ80_00140 [Gemmatimonadota bacterium]